MVHKTQQPPVRNPHSGDSADTGLHPAEAIRIEASYGQIPSHITLSKIQGILLSVAVLGIATNFLIFAVRRDFYTPDSASYLASAGNLVHGRGFTDSQGYPEVIRTPGYPLLIAPFLWMGLDLKYLIILQHVLQTLTALGGAIFAYQVSKRRWQALIAGILLCLDLPSLNAANTVMTETLFTAILTIAIWLLWRGVKRQQTLWQLAFAAFLCGVSVLVRPITIYFFLPAVAYLLLTSKKLQLSAAAVFCSVFACLPLGWMARNHFHTGDFSVSAISGWNMLMYRAAGALAINDPGDFSVNLEKREAQLLREVCESTSGPVVEDCSPSKIPQKAIALKSTQFMALGQKTVLQHPFAYAKLAIRGAALIMLGGDASLIMHFTGARPWIVTGLILVYTFPLCCFAMVGLWRFWTEDRSFFWLAVLVVGYFLIVSSGAEAYSRLRVPIMPVYAVLIACGIEYTLARMSFATRFLKLAARQGSRPGER